MFEARLIKEISKNKCIWNKHCNEYRNKPYVDQTWMEVARSVVEEGYPFTEDYCRKRWKSLRDRFVREHGAKTEGKDKSGKVWEFYKPMLFLSDFVTFRGSSNCSMKIPKRIKNELAEDESSSFFTLVNAELNAIDMCTIEDLHDGDHDARGCEANPSSTVLEGLGVAPVGNNTRADIKSVDRQIKDLQNQWDSETRVAMKHSNNSNENYSGSRQNKMPKYEETFHGSVEDNAGDLTLLKRTTNDPFLAAVGEIFERVNDIKKLQFKMDILNYAYKRYGEMQ